MFLLLTQYLTLHCSLCLALSLWMPLRFYQLKFVGSFPLSFVLFHLFPLFPFSELVVPRNVMMSLHINWQQFQTLNKSLFRWEIWSFLFIFLYTNTIYVPGLKRWAHWIFLRYFRHIGDLGNTKSDLVMVRCRKLHLCCRSAIMFSFTLAGNHELQEVKRQLADWLADW